MTCIVAVEVAVFDIDQLVISDYEAVLGSDSFLGGAFVKDQTDRPKFFEKGKRFFIAFAGGMRGAQIVQHDLSFRKIRKSEEEESYLVTEVSKKLQAAFANVGANIKDPGSVDTHDANFLVCLNGKIFIIQNDYSVIRSRNGYAAIGAGQDFALGALAALEQEEITPHEKVRRALEAAEHLSPQVCKPFHIVEV